MLRTAHARSFESACAGFCASILLNASADFGRTHGDSREIRVPAKKTPSSTGASCQELFPGRLNQQKHTLTPPATTASPTPWRAPPSAARSRRGSVAFFQERAATPRRADPISNARRPRRRLMSNRTAARAPGTHQRRREHGRRRPRAAASPPALERRRPSRDDSARLTAELAKELDSPLLPAA